MKITSYEDALRILARYPYFTYAAVCARRMAMDPAEAERLSRIIDLQRGVSHANPGEEISEDARDADSTPSSPASCSSADAIDIFLAHYSNPANETPLQYIPGLDRPGTCVAPIQSPEVEEAPLSEQEQANILIKNHKYAEALAIIERLNLNNPEKSIYFADQIRFLKKLIINQAKANS